MAKPDISEPNVFQQNFLRRIWDFIFQPVPRDILENYNNIIVQNWLQNN